MAGSVRSVAVRLSAEVSGYIAGMRSAGKATKDALGDATKYASEHEKSLNKVGATAGKVGLTAAAGLGAIVYASANFDQAMSNVQAATHETTQNMDSLREAALQAGADTAFSASEAAEGIEALAKAGVQTEEVLSGGLTGALDLAAAGGMEVADAAEAAAGAMAQFKLDGSQVPHIADLLAAGAGKAQGEVSDMVMALKQAGTVSAQTGLTLEETTGALAAMAEQSLLGSDAGTSFKTMLAALTPNSEKAAAAMEQYNIHAFDAQGNFVGMTALAGQLERGLGNLTDEQRAMTLETIFGSDAVRAASIIYDNGADGIQKWINNVDDAGYAAETASIKMDNLAGDWEAFTGSLETALIGAGESSQGPLRSIVQGGTDLVNAFSDAPPLLQNTATGLLAITAVTGGGVWLGTKIITSIADTKTALKDLGVQAGTTGRIMKTSLGTAGIVGGLLILDDVLDDVFNVDIDTSKLGRSLDALADGRVTGEILTQFGSDLSGFASDVKLAASDIGGVSSFLGDIPLLGDALGGPQQDALNRLKEIDEALAGMVEVGQGNQAAAVFRQLSDAAVEAGVDVDQVTTLFEQYEIAVANASGAKTTGGAILAPLEQLRTLLPGVSGAAGDTAGSVDGLAGAMDGAQAEAYTLENAMAALFGKVDVDAALVSWKNGLAGLKEAVKDNVKTLKVNTQAGRDNRDEIRGNVNDLRTWAEAVYEQTGNIDGLRARLLKGREAIIAQAEAAGFSKKETEAYLKELGLTPKEIRTDVALMGTQEAENQIDGVQVKLSALDRRIALATVRARDEASAVIAAIRNSMLNLHDKTIYIRSVHTTSRLGDETKLATGGPVVGPGSGTSDDVPILASNGEHMWTAAETKAVGGHSAMMRLRYLAKSGQLRGYATGGGIGAGRTATAAPSSSPYATQSLAGLSVTGTLQTPWGPADIVGIVDDRIAAGARHDRATGRR